MKSYGSLRLLATESTESTTNSGVRWQQQNKLGAPGQTFAVVNDPAFPRGTVIPQCRKLYPLPDERHEGKPSSVVVFPAFLGKY